MGLDISSTQQKRLDKIERLRPFYVTDHPKIYEWHAHRDEPLDFKTMTDAEVVAYIGSAD
jgi:hypothetical protein